MKETEIVRQCLDYLSLKGIFAWRQNNIAVRLPGGQFRKFHGLRGVSDILGILSGGRFLAIEVKAPGGKLREEQTVFLQSISDLGGVALVVHSLEELERDLNEVLETEVRE